jgi:hypothetical protein
MLKKRILVRPETKEPEAVRLKTFLCNVPRFLIGTTAIAVAFYGVAVFSRVLSPRPR